MERRDQEVKQAQESAAAAIQRAQEERVQEATTARSAVELANARASILEIQLKDVQEELTHAREVAAGAVSSQEQDRASFQAQVSAVRCSAVAGSPGYRL